MGSMYNNIMHFMEEYFPAFSQYSQVAENHRLMDKFYAPELCFDDNVAVSREQWYKACLSHPAILDILKPEHLFIDEKQKEVGALLTTQYVDRATGKLLLEVKMNVLYYLNIDQNKDIKIRKVRVFVESNPSKVNKISKIFKKGA
jgi:hypothetical protein